MVVVQCVASDFIYVSASIGKSALCMDVVHGAASDLIYGFF